MCNINWIDEDLKYIWHPCSQMKDYEELKPIDYRPWERFLSL